MYTFWKRTSPYPSLLVFDEPTADTTTVRRTRSNSPMQALTLLNDEAFVEMTQALASRVLREAPANDRDRMRYAFRLCLAREPDASEKDSLSTTFNTFLERYRQKPEEARELMPAGVREDPVRYAAWFGVARVLLSLDETITRE